MQPTKTDSRRRLNAVNSTPAVGEYVKVVENQCETDGFVNEQWVEPTIRRPIPWKTITIILALFSGGLVSILFGVLEPRDDSSYCGMPLFPDMHRLRHSQLGDGHEP